MCAGVVPQQPPKNVEPTVARPFAGDARHICGRVIELAESVGQTGVGIARHQSRREARHFADVGPHLFRPQRAVERVGKQIVVRNRSHRRLQNLPAQSPPRSIGNRQRRDNRHALVTLVPQLANREQSRLEIVRIERRFGQQQIDAAVQQRARLFLVGLDHLAPRNRAKRRIVHVGRHRQRPVRRPQRARHKTRFAIL